MGNPPPPVSLDDIWRWVLDGKDFWTPGWRSDPPSNYALGSLEEAGEIASVFKFRAGVGSQTNVEKPDALAEEVFDQLVYNIAMLTCEGVTREQFLEVVRRKANLVVRRFEDRAKGGTGQLHLGDPGIE